MKERIFVGIMVVLALVLFLSVPVFAQDLNYSGEYKFDGTIDQKMQAGHKCNTGGVLKQTITGTGAMTKEMDVAMVQGKLTVNDVNDWVTAPDALRNLTVTSVIELCAPPKYIYDHDAIDAIIDEAGLLEAFYSLPMPPPTVYASIGAWFSADEPPQSPGYLPTSLEDLFDVINAMSPTASPNRRAQFTLLLNDLLASEEFLIDAVPALKGVVHPLAIYGSLDQPYIFGPNGFEGMNYNMAGTYDDWEAVSKQIWAVQVEASPGFSGNLHQKFEAAYGPYTAQVFGEGEKPEGGDSDRWGWLTDDDGVISPVVGDDYVGNYFNMEQYARTSQGTVKRFIDISSPWSHGYLKVDSTITGLAEVKEEFKMDNLEAGPNSEPDWWELF